MALLLHDAGPPQNGGGGTRFPQGLPSNWVVTDGGGEPNVILTLPENEKLKNVNVKNIFYIKEM